MDKKQNTIIAILAAVLIGGYLVYVNYFKNASTTNTPNIDTINTTNAECVQVTYTSPVYNNAVVTYKDCSGSTQSQEIASGQSATISCLQGSDSVKYIPISASLISSTSIYSAGQIVNNQVVVANTVQTIYTAPSDASLLISYTDIYGQPATAVISAGNYSYIDCVLGSDTAKVLPLVLKSFSTQPNTLSLVTYYDQNNILQGFYLVDPSIDTTKNPSGTVFKSPRVVRLIQGTDTVTVAQYDTKTYTAPNGSSITINYIDWTGQPQQLFILNRSSTINCIKGSDSIISTVPFDFTSQLGNIYAVPVLGAKVNSTYALPSSFNAVCPINQPCTQACQDYITQSNQKVSDLISQRLVKGYQDNGNNTNSITSQMAGNAGAVAHVVGTDDPNAVKILTQLLSVSPSTSDQSTIQNVGSGGNSGSGGVSHICYDPTGQTKYCYS